MTKVVVDCRMAHWSGVGRYARGLVRGLSSLPGLSLVLVTAAGGEPVLSDSRGVVTVETVHGPFALRGMLELADVAERQQPDLVHCLHFPTPWRVDTPLVVTLHDLTPLVVPGAMPSVFRRTAYRELNRRAVRLAARIITPSDSTARDVDRLYPASRGKTVVIAEAADDFSAGETGELPQRPAQPHPPYILTMGNTKAHKDLPTLFAAFQQLSQSRPVLEIILVGEEPSGYLDAMLSGEPRRRARFTGEVDDAQLRTLYAGASIFAFPSRYEGFGLPLLEAMSFGAPVVATQAASVPEVVGDAALLSPPGDVRALTGNLARLLDDADLRRQLGRRGRQRAAQFTWARTARQTAGVYEEVLDARSR